jgi:aminoglycoside phosphotransferase (APT) family kinase protein
MTRLRLEDSTARARLADFIAKASAAVVTALEVSPLSGGAIQENWLVAADLDGKRQEMVLRTDAPSRVAVSHGRAEEFAILRAAFAAGVSAPEPLWLCRDIAVLGQVFYLMRRAAGVAPGYRVVRDKSLGGDRVKLAERLGSELARIHTIKPGALGARGLDFLPPPRQGPALDQIAALRGDLDRRAVGYPVLEWGLRWAERHLPAAAEITLIHQDFRSGNYMVDGRGLTAVLDWEFACWGDPMADIGWFCAKCWRYGEDALEAGGIARREDFYRGYEAAGGRKVDATAVHFWEVMAHLRWAIIALQQADRHISGQQRSLELALTGRILPELELTIIELIAPGPWPTAARAARGDEPNGAALLAEARRLLAEELLAQLPEARRYEARMIANAMAIAGREMASRTPAADDLKAFAADVRRGRHDTDASLRERLAADVLARLAISNPKALPRD